jgi:cysteine dioxygenase
MDEINSLSLLIQKLNAAEKSEVPALLKNLRLPKQDFDSFASWCDDGYTRNCVHRTESYELILLCWSKGCVTPIHGHGGQECWVYQIEGNLTEKRFEKNAAGNLIETEVLTLQAGDLTYMEDRMGYHQLCNQSDTKGYTLHLYASPIDTCEIFNETTNSFEIKEMSYDTMKKKELV